MDVKTGLNPFEPPKAVAMKRIQFRIPASARADRRVCRWPSTTIGSRWPCHAAEPSGMQDPMGAFGPMGPMGGETGQEAPIQASIIVAADEGITRDRLARIIDDVRRNGADRLKQVPSERVPPRRAEAKETRKGPSRGAIPAVTLRAPQQPMQQPPPPGSRTSRTRTARSVQALSC